MTESERPPAKIWGCVGLLTVFTVGGLVAAPFLIPRAPKTEKKAIKGSAGRPIPVKLATVKEQEIPVELHVVGSVTPFSTVPVTSQVTGQLIKVNFQQGDFVSQGQPLFVLDSRPQRASLDQAEAVTSKDQAQISQASASVGRDLALVRQAEAALAKDIALVQQARSNLARDLAQFRYANDQNKRYQNLLDQGYVTAEQAGQQQSTARSLEGTLAADRAAVQAAEATVAADKAAIQSAKATALSDSASVRSLQATLDADRALASSAQVQLGYTEIRAPLSGRTGTLNIYEGTVVRANDTQPLVTIGQIQPIRVTFAVPEKYLGEIRDSQRRQSLAVSAQLADQKGPKESGKVNFIENTVDPSTGTITMRAQFPNMQRRLWPGQFVNVNLLLRRLPHALTVPSQSVQPGQKGDYVFVIKADKTAEVRPVQVDFTYGDLTIIRSGLSSGETVVTDGQLQLIPGDLVESSEHKGKKTQ